MTNTHTNVLEIKYKLSKAIPTLAELSLLNKATKVVATLVTAVQVVEGVVAEVVVRGRGAAVCATHPSCPTSPCGTLVTPTHQ